MPFFLIGQRTESILRITVHTERISLCNFIFLLQTCLINLSWPNFNFRFINCFSHVIILHQSCVGAQDSVNVRKILSLAGCRLVKCVVKGIFLRTYFRINEVWIELSLVNFVRLFFQFLIIILLVLKQICICISVGSTPTNRTFKLISLRRFTMRRMSWVIPNNLIPSVQILSSPLLICLLSCFRYSLIIFFLIFVILKVNTNLIWLRPLSFLPTIWSFSKHLKIGIMIKHVIWLLLNCKIDFLSFSHSISVISLSLRIPNRHLCVLLMWSNGMFQGSNVFNHNVAEIILIIGWEIRVKRSEGCLIGHWRRNLACSWVFLCTFLFKRRGFASIFEHSFFLFIINIYTWAMFFVNLNTFIGLSEALIRSVSIHIIDASRQHVENFSLVHSFFICANCFILSFI